MANIAKNVFLKSRQLLVRDVTRSLEKLDGKLSSVHSELRDMQLQINHGHMQVLEELNKRTKNSGTLTISEREIITKIFSGLKLYLDPRDVAVVPHLALDSIWEHRITAAWLRVVKPTNTVIDIGANFGYFGVLAAQVTDKKDSKVIMFEANPHLIPYIKKTLAVNWLNEQSVLENLAISDKPGVVTLNLLKDYIGSSSIHTTAQLNTYMHGKMHIETQEEIKVKAVTLDDYCKAHKITRVDLLKMDIEGYEETAYEGMRGIIKVSPNPTLFVEFTKDGYEKPQKFYEQMLGDFGYVYTIDDDGHLLKPDNTSYEAIIGDADDWVMPVFSKNANLATRV